MKKTKLWLLTMAMSLCCVAVNAHDFEVDGFYYNITSTTDMEVEVTFKENSAGELEDVYSGIVEVPSSVLYDGKEYRVTAIGECAFSGCQRISNMTVPNSIRAIGLLAFSNCTGELVINCNIPTPPEDHPYYSKGAFYGSNFTGITFGKGVTSIGNYAFHNCSSLTSITIPEGVTSIGESTFSRCSSLTSITLPEGLTSIGNYAFQYCSSLTSITIPEDVTSIGYDAFQYCSSLTSITLPEGVTSIGEAAFFDCESLTSITIPEGVTSIGEDTFSGCRSLTSINIPEGVTSIGEGAFYGCRSLTSITIPEGVTSIGEAAFSFCSSLTSINIPEGVTSIGGSAFEGCSGLTSITIPESVTSIGELAFRDCSSLTSITIPESVTSIGSSAFYGCHELKGVHINSLEGWCNIDFIGESSNPLCYAENLYIDEAKGPVKIINIPNSVKKLKNHVFHGYKKLIAITIPEGVTSIGNHAFAGTLIKNVSIPKSVTSIEYRAFSDCDSLKSVNILEGVKEIGDAAFQGCDSLKYVDIPSSIIRIGSGVFSGTNVPVIEAMNGIYKSGWLIGYTDDALQTNSFTVRDNTIGITKNALYNSGFVRVSIPSSVKHIGSNGLGFPDSICIEDIGSWCSIDLEKEQHARKGLFIDGKAVKDVSIPEGIETLNYPFYFNDSITSVALPESVTSIGDSAFYNCESLTSISIPNSVTSIGEDAFFNCKKLKDVYISDLESWLNIEFGKRVYMGIVDDIEFQQDSILNGSYYSNPLYYAKNLYVNNKLTTDIVIPKNVTEIPCGAFWHFRGIKSVVIGNNITKIGNHAFVSCTKLSSVTIGKNVKEIGCGAFAYAEPSSVYIDDLVSWCNILFGDLYSNPLCGDCNLYLNNQPVTDLTIPNGVTKINDHAFRGCYSLTNVNIGDHVKSIGDHAFQECYNLASVNIGDGVTYIGDGAFYVCPNLKSVTMGNNVESIGLSAFYYGKMDSITLSENLKKIGIGAFWGCKKFTSISIPNSVTTIGEYAFENCVGLTSVSIGNGLKSIDEKVFCQCLSLAAIVIPDNIEEIGYGAFTGCTDLSSVVLGDNVKTIGPGAFSHCTNLSSITFPESVDSIKQQAFYNCTNLRTVYCHDVEPALCGEKLYGYIFISAYYDIDLSACTLYVPDESIEAYKVAEGWKDFGSILPLSASNIESTLTSNVEIYGGRGMLTVKGIHDGEIIRVYTLDGRLLTCKISKGNNISIAVPAGKIYLVEVANEVKKIKI